MSSFRKHLSYQNFGTWAGIETGRIWDGTYLGGHVMPKPAAACPTITSWEEIWAPNIDCACGWVPTLGAD